MSDLRPRLPRRNRPWVAASTAPLLAVLIRLKRMLTASQIALASAALFLLRLRRAFTLGRHQTNHLRQSLFGAAMPTVGAVRHTDSIVTTRRRRLSEAEKLRRAS
jgi:hypothetical protein